MSSPEHLAYRMQRAAFELGHALGKDRRVDPARITTSLFAAAVGLAKSLGEMAAAAEADGRADTAEVLRAAQADQDQVVVALARALKDFKG